MLHRRSRQGTRRGRLRGFQRAEGRRSPRRRWDGRRWGEPRWRRGRSGAPRSRRRSAQGPLLAGHPGGRKAPVGHRRARRRSPQRAAHERTGKPSARSTTEERCRQKPGFTPGRRGRGTRLPRVSHVRGHGGVHSREARMRVKRPSGSSMWTQWPASGSRWTRTRPPERCAASAPRAPSASSKTFDFPPITRFRESPGGAPRRRTRGRGRSSRRAWSGSRGHRGEG
jgi:hypothetical protein